jgi:membrane associated rhomboid family serine protease
MTFRLLLALAVVQFLQWTVVLPVDVQAWLAFHRDDTVLGRWWTLGTHPLVHGDLTLLAMNAYVLALFGLRMERTWGPRRYLRLLLLGTLTGWTTHLFGGGAGPWMGASSAAYAVLAAYALRWGDEPHLVLGRMPVTGRWIALLMAGALLLTGLDGGGVKLGTPSEVIVEAPVVPTVAPSVVPTEPPSFTPPPSIDAILDKISAEGIDHLTDEERRVLDDHSRRLRDR